MKATELIKKLQNIVKKEGDIETAIKNIETAGGSFYNKWNKLDNVVKSDIVFTDDIGQDIHREITETYVVLEPGEYIASDNLSFYRLK